MNFTKIHHPDLFQNLKLFTLNVLNDLSSGTPMPRLYLQPCVYILASFNGQALYVGVTSDLMKRIGQHRDGYFDGHSKKYKIQRLVWFEVFGTMEAAIAREKQLKNWHRQWKVNHVTASNPTWRDLAEDLGFPPLEIY
jgi:putative endonuclease